MNRLWLTVVTGVLMVGCGQVDQPAPTATGGAATNAAPKSTAQEAIEGFTGKTAVDAGQRAKAKLNAIDAARRKDIDSALGQ